MTSQETWKEFVARATNSMSQTRAAELTGVPQTNISRWLRGDPGAPRAESVVAFARALDESPVAALVAAGYLTASEASATVSLKEPLRAYTTDRLLGELRRRVSGDR